MFGPERGQLIAEETSIKSSNGKRLKPREDEEQEARL